MPSAIQQSWRYWHSSPADSGGNDESKESRVDSASCPSLPNDDENAIPEEFRIDAEDHDAMMNLRDVCLARGGGHEEHVESLAISREEVSTLTASNAQMKAFLVSAGLMGEFVEWCAARGVAVPVETKQN